MLAPRTRSDRNRPCALPFDKAFLLPLLALEGALLTRSPPCVRSPFPPDSKISGTSRCACASFVRAGALRADPRRSRSLLQSLGRRWHFAESFAASFCSLNFLGGTRSLFFLGILAGGPLAMWSMTLASIFFMTSASSSRRSFDPTMARALTLARSLLLPTATAAVLAEIWCGSSTSRALGGP